MTVKKEDLKSKVSLKNLPTVDYIFPMLRTLTVQYGNWLDMNYKSILDELDEESNNGYNELLCAFTKHFGEYVEFIDNPYKD